MRKITVDVKEVWDHSITFDAPDGATREELLKMAHKVLEEGTEEEENTEYNRTLDDDEWTVRTEGGDFI